MKSGVGRKYVIYLSLILVGVFVCGGLLTGPLKNAADSFTVPAMEKNIKGESGPEHPSQVAKLFVIVFLVFTIYGAHLAARFFSDRTWRRRDHYTRDVRWSVVDFLAMVFLYLALAGAYTTFFAHPSGASGAAGEKALLGVMVTTCFYLVVLLFGIWMLKLRGGSFAEGMGLTIRPYGRLILIGVVAFLAFQPLHFIYKTAVVAVFHGLSVPIESHPVVEQLLKPDGMAVKLSIALSVVLAVPFFEEIFFRGFLYRAVRKTMDPVAAIAVTAALFAIVHPWVFQASLVLPLGFLLAYLMEKTGSVIPCMVVHFLVNGTSLLLTFLVAT